MSNTHSVAIGYLVWIFGFFGAHRFYFGRPITGTIWFFTGGLFLIGWMVDLFLIPGMDQEADSKYAEGDYDYTLLWIALTFGGIFGIHKFLMGKYFIGLIYLLTGGLFLFGYLYDLATLNSQVHALNSSKK